MEDLEALEDRVREYAAKTRPSSARSTRDEELKHEVTRIHAANFGVYGVRKLWRALRREGSPIGRDRAARLMTALGLTGVNRAKSIRTTQPGPLVVISTTTPTSFSCGACEIRGHCGGNDPGNFTTTTGRARWLCVSITALRLT